MALDRANRYSTIAEFGHDLFALFHAISDRSPHDLILRYLHDPASIPAWVPEKKKSSPKWAIIIGGSIALLGLLLGAIAAIKLL